MKNDSFFPGKNHPSLISGLPMALLNYDPLSFLGTYTQRPEGGFPKPLLNIIKKYLASELWGFRMNNVKDLLKTPQKRLVVHLNILVKSGYPDQVDTLLDLYWSHLKFYPQEVWLRYRAVKLLSPKNMFTLAAQHGCLALVKHLSFAVGDFPPPLAIFAAASRGHRDVVDYLLSIGGNPNDILSGGVHSNRREMVDYALSLGANNLVYALNQAVWSNHPAMLSYLLTLRPMETRDLRNALRNAHYKKTDGMDRSEIIHRLERALEEKNRAIV